MLASVQDSEDRSLRLTRAASAVRGVHAFEGVAVASREGGVMRGRSPLSRRERRLLLGVGAVLATAAFTAPALADSSANKVNFLDLPAVATCDGPIGGTPDTSFAV